MNSRLFPSQAKASPGPSPAELLAKMPRKPLTPEQQLAALDKVQAQATQRIKLGQQLFKAAEARLTQQQEVLDQIQNQQQILRDQVQEDVAKSLQTYDQWMGKIDESFTGAVRELSDRLTRLEAQQQDAKQEMQMMVARAAALMEQTQQLMLEAFGEEEVVDIQPSSPAPACEDPAQPNELESALLGDDYPQPIEHAQPETPPGPLPNEIMKLDEEEDVFGQVLQRLRDADEDEQAAA